MTTRRLFISKKDTTEDEGRLYFSFIFQAGALIELSGDVYYEEYDIHELPPLDKTDG